MISIKPNSEIKDCIDKLKNGQKILQTMPIEYSGPFRFEQIDSAFIYEPPVEHLDYVAAFDLDWTLSYGKKQLFPKDPEDIQILPNRRKALEDLIMLIKFYFLLY